MHPLRTLVCSALAGVALLATATAAGARPEIAPAELVSPQKPMVTNGLRGHHGGLNDGSVPSRPTTQSEILTINADHHPMTYHRMLHHGSRHDRVHANGHCNGRASGSGYRGCGTATGGPVGGLPNRN